MIRNRYRTILVFFARIISALILWELVLPRFGLRRLVARTRPARLRRIGSASRAMAVRMGGVMIKLGQFLSSRLDVLPDEITSELAGLQDEVPPEDFNEIRNLAEEELGSSLSDRYASFDTHPLAAASLGQVHRAQLHADTERNNGVESGLEAFVPHVVVKIQRPNIEAIIATDLRALRTVGTWLERYPPIRRRVNIPGLLIELERVLGEEIDYLAEAGNVEIFAENFNHRPGVRVPKVIWSHTTRRVLTLEDVYAIKITDYHEITAAGINRGEVAKRLFHTYMQQIFVDGFVHADPHPGNLFVQPHPAQLDEEPAWELTFVDFGMVAQVRPEHYKGLREMAIGLATSDSARLVRSFQMLGFLLPDADLDLIQQAQAIVFERMWGKSMGELRSIDYDQMLDIAKDFRHLIYQMPFQVPQNMIFLGRTVAILSGMCTGLDPDFNLWEELSPYAREFLSEEAGSEVMRWLRETMLVIQTFPAAMQRLNQIMGKLDRGEMEVHAPQVSNQISRLEFSVRRLVGALIFAAFLISGAQFYLANQQYLGLILFGGALISLMWVILTRR
jgi:predicted unusual protein kinase regulating ubiquinone biosynthesis (AarF/ABC1/UbiB family)